MSDLQPQQDTKSVKEVFTDFLLEIIGYERGFYRTFIDLRKQPRVVVENYLTKTNVYVSPFKILISIVTVWLLFNNFIIDWYKIWNVALDTYTKWEWHRLHETDAIPEKILNLNKFMAKVAGDLFSKYYMAFVIIGTPFWAYICYRSCKAFNIDFRTHLAVVGYHFSLGFIPAFIFIICLALSFWLFLAIAFIIVLSPLVGLRSIYNKALVIVPVSSFFEKDGLIIEKKYYRARLLTTFLFIFVYILLCLAYYSIYPI